MWQLESSHSNSKSKKLVSKKYSFTNLSVIFKEQKICFKGVNKWGSILVRNLKKLLNLQSVHANSKRLLNMTMLENSIKSQFNKIVYPKIPLWPMILYAGFSAIYKLADTYKWTYILDWNLVLAHICHHKFFVIPFLCSCSVKWRCVRKSAARFCYIIVWPMKDLLDLIRNIIIYLIRRLSGWLEFFICLSVPYLQYVYFRSLQNVSQLTCLPKRIIS